MKTPKFLPLIFAFLLIFNVGKAQQTEIDSLKQALSSQTDDTLKVKSLIHLSRVLASADDAGGMEYAIAAKDLSGKIGFRRGSAMSFAAIAMIDNFQEDYAEALQNYMKGVEINKEIQDNNLLAIDYNDIGTIYSAMNNEPEALRYFLQAETILETLEDKHRLGIICNNISAVYFAQDNSDKAIQYGIKALLIAESDNDKMMKAAADDNLGKIHSRNSENDVALNYFNDALAIYDTLGNKYDMAQEELNIGNIYRNKENIPESQKWYQKTETLASELSASELLRDVSLALSENYQSMGKYEDALSYYKRYSSLNDSLLQEDFSGKIAKMEMKFDLGKKDLEIRKMKEQEEKLTQSMKGRSSTFILIGIVVLILLAFLIYIVIASQKISNLKSTIENERAMNFNNYQKPGNRGNSVY